MKMMLVVLAVPFVTGAACGPTRDPDPGNPVAVVSCPLVLPPVTDDTFGGTVARMVEWAGIYHKCRTAAVGAGTKKPPAPSGEGG